MNTNAKSTKCIVGDAPCFWGTSFSMEEKRGISMLRVAGDTASLPARLDLTIRKFWKRQIVSSSAVQEQQVLRGTRALRVQTTVLH